LPSPCILMKSVALMARLIWRAAAACPMDWLGEAKDAPPEGIRRGKAGGTIDREQLPSFDGDEHCSRQIAARLHRH
jgi:hypothetical protein